MYRLRLINTILSLRIDYWTEKLGDAFLGFALPIYYGCPNIFDYFSADSLRIIDADNFDQSIAVLEELIYRDPFSEHIEVVLPSVLRNHCVKPSSNTICPIPESLFAKIKSRCIFFAVPCILIAFRALPILNRCHYIVYRFILYKWVDDNHVRPRLNKKELLVLYPSNGFDENTKVL